MGIYHDVQSALEVKLATLSPAVQTFPTNIESTPVLSTSYITHTMLYADTVGGTIDGKDIYPGILQLDIYTKLSKGVGPNLVIQDNLRTLFNNVLLTKNSTYIRVDKIALGPLNKQDAWCRGVLEIHFTAWNW